MKKIFIILLLLIFHNSLFADQWPSDPFGITSTLGNPKERSFTPGVHISNTNTNILPFSDGEVLFFNDNEVSDFPLNLDQVLVLEHDNGFRTIYGNVKFESSVTKRSFIKSNDVLGSTDKLYFFIKDAKLDIYVNPLKLAPHINDKIPPIIENVLLVGPGGTKNLGSLNSTFKSGTYFVYVRALDSIKSGSENRILLPYSYSLFYLGNNISQIQFDALAMDKGRCHVIGKDTKSWDELYDRDGYLNLGILTLLDGKGIISIVVKDYSGNETTASYTVNVK